MVILLVLTAIASPCLASLVLLIVAQRGETACSNLTSACACYGAPRPGLGCAIEGKVEVRNQNLEARDGDILRTRGQWIGMTAFITKQPRTTIAVAVGDKTTVGMLSQKVGIVHTPRALETPNTHTHPTHTPKNHTHTHTPFLRHTHARIGFETQFRFSLHAEKTDVGPGGAAGSVTNSRTHPTEHLLLAHARQPAAATCAEKMCCRPNDRWTFGANAERSAYDRTVPLRLHRT